MNSIHIFQLCPELDHLEAITWHGEVKMVDLL